MSKTKLFEGTKETVKTKPSKPLAKGDAYAKKAPPAKGKR